MGNVNPNYKTRTIFGVAILLMIAAIHAFRLGTYLNGKWYTLYYSYISDLIMPFGIYFLLCMIEFQFPFLRKWRTKAALVFSACAFTEILQYFGIYALGVTFDPLDILMFGLGVALAVITDQLIFNRLLPNWKY